MGWFHKFHQLDNEDFRSFKLRKNPNSHTHTNCLSLSLAHIYAPLYKSYTRSKASNSHTKLSISNNIYLLLLFYRVYRYLFFLYFGIQCAYIIKRNEMKRKRKKWFSDQEIFSSDHASKIRIVLHEKSIDFWFYIIWKRNSAERKKEREKKRC